MAKKRRALKKKAASARRTTAGKKKAAPARKATAGKKKAAPTRKATAGKKKAAPARKTTAGKKKAASARNTPGVSVLHETSLGGTERKVLEQRCRLVERLGPDRVEEHLAPVPLEVTKEKGVGHVRWATDRSRAGLGVAF